MEIVHKAKLQVKEGKDKIGVGFMGITDMKQLTTGEIIFGSKENVLFDFLSYDFDGPIYNAVIDVTQKGKVKSKETKKTKKKGKSGKVVMGALLGNALLPGAGALIGAYAGGKGKDKGKNQTNGVVKSDGKTTEIQKQVEVKGTATIFLKNKQTGTKFSILVDCDSKINNQLANFQVKEESPSKASVQLVDSEKPVLEQIKDYKELLDMDIITRDEFDQKKKELLGL